MKEERSKKFQTNNKAKQHGTPQAVTFPKKMYTYMHVHAICIYTCICIHVYIYDILQYSHYFFKPQVCAYIC